MYDVSLDSIYEAEAFPRCIRNPDSSFSVAWDVSSVVLLLYVAGAVRDKSDCRFRKIATESVRESGVKWLSWTAT